MPKRRKFVQFSDHIIGPRKSQHFHIFMGNESQEALLKENGELADRSSVCAA